jgi:hypothetical protein
MKLTLKALLALGLFASMGTVSTVALADGCCGEEDDSDCGSGCRTKFLPISVGENRARDYVEVTRFQFLPNQDDWNWHASVAIEYQQNFDRCRLGKYFFPTNNTLTAGGCGVAGVDIRAVDLGLSSTINATLRIEPKITNWVIEPALYVGLDRWIEGLWFWFKVPVAHTRWNLDCCETRTANGGATFNPAPTGAGASSTNKQEALKSNLAPYTTNSTATVCSVGATTLTAALAGVAFCDASALCAGKIECCGSSKTRVADLPIHLGYNFINQDNGYLGIYGRLVLPLGNRAEADRLFAPAIGYGRWQLGAGLNGRIQLYDKDEDTQVNLFGDLSATYIFKRSECRVFDMAGLGCMSRFTLLKEADTNGNYTGNLVHFADLFSACVKSGFSWNIDGLLFLDLKHKGWNVDLGYEFQYRNKEKIDCDCLSRCNACDDCNSCGDSWFGGSSCNKATSLGGKSYGVKGTLDLDGIGNKVTTASTTKINACTAVGGADANPVLINDGNFTTYLDLDSGRIPSATSNKIWANVGYTWSDRDYPVSLGAFGEVAFGRSHKALRIWGIGAKAAIAYN